MSRKYGMSSGYVEALNHKSGTVTVADGSTSASVTFDEPMDNPPAVVATPTDSGESVFIDQSTVTADGFTVDGLTSTGANDVYYVAIDESRY